MTGRHIDDEPLELAVGNPLKGICHDLMVSPCDE